MPGKYGSKNTCSRCGGYLDDDLPTLISLLQAKLFPETDICKCNPDHSETTVQSNSGNGLSQESMEEERCYQFGYYNACMYKNDHAE